MPEDALPASAAFVEPRPRLAWLLAVNRRRRAGGRHEARAGFVEELHRRGVAADLPRLSRWESGQQPVPGRVLAAYESILDLHPAALAAVTASLTRSGAPAAPAALVQSTDGAPTSEHLDWLLGRATARGRARGGELTGQQWHELAEGLRRYDGVFLQRDQWARLTGRLLDAVDSSRGPSRLVASEAATVLLRHRAARPHVVAQLSERVSTGRDVGVVALAGTSEHPTVAGLAVGWLAGDDPAVADAAAAVVARQVARGRLRPAALTRVVGALTAPGPRRDERPTAAVLGLVARLPATQREVLLAELRSEPLRQRVRAMAASGLLVPEHVARRTARRLAHGALAATGAELEVIDPMLERLVAELTFHVEPTRRLLAGQLLQLSPYDGVLDQPLQDLARSEDLVVRQAATTTREQLGLD